MTATARAYDFPLPRGAKIASLRCLPFSGYVNELTIMSSCKGLNVKGLCLLSTRYALQKARTSLVILSLDCLHFSKIFSNSLES